MCRKSAMITSFVVCFMENELSEFSSLTTNKPSQSSLPAYALVKNDKPKIKTNVVFL
ncbi:MAG: hypothetical protein AB7F64_05475 [Gammaproteobacteria bacterium]